MTEYDRDRAEAEAFGAIPSVPQPSMENQLQHVRNRLVAAHNLIHNTQQENLELRKVIENQERIIIALRTQIDDMWAKRM